MEINAFKIESMPNIPIAPERFFEIIGKNPSIIIYDIKNGSTSLYIHSDRSDTIMGDIENSIMGLKFNKDPNIISTNGAIITVIPYVKPLEKSDQHAFDDIFEMFKNTGFIAIISLPQDEGSIDSAKNIIEAELSGVETKKSAVLQKSKSSNISFQYDIFEGSEDAIVLNDILGSINFSMTKNGIIYKCFIAISSQPSDLINYVDSRIVAFKHDTIYPKSINDLILTLNKTESFLVGIDILKRFFGIYGHDKVEYIMPTITPKTSGDIELGSYLAKSVNLTQTPVQIQKETLNLGCIISGLPGSGKSREAMAIIDALYKSNSRTKTKIVVIAPTEEWDNFAISHNMNLLRLQKDMVPINFFRCPDNVDPQKFYTDLGMIIAAASTAGPYRDPIEKCLINAFRSIYKTTNNPNPSLVFDRINASIIKLHGKISNAGVKYTKHGENIKSSLEGLIEIISRREYSGANGIKLEELIEDGVVFNISNSGLNSRSYLYSLILNQIYAISSTYDNNGDTELRLLTCIEEAQTIFKDPKSPAVEDIKFKIQDFRKKGIGLMLLTHNIIDIDASIRRLCQTKIYLKQAPDIAPIISKDLIFTFCEEDDITKRLKNINSRVAAINYVSKDGNSKKTNETIFILTKDYPDIPISDSTPKNLCKAKYVAAPSDIETKITIAYSPDMEVMTDKIAKMRYLRINYFQETIFEITIKTNPIITKLIEGRDYTVELLDDKKRVIKREKIIAERDIRIEVS